MERKDETIRVFRLILTHTTLDYLAHTILDYISANPPSNNAINASSARVTPEEKRRFLTRRAQETKQRRALFNAETDAEEI